MAGELLQALVDETAGAVHVAPLARKPCLEERELGPAEGNVVDQPIEAIRDAIVHQLPEQHATLPRALVKLDADLRRQVDAAVRRRFSDLTEEDLRESASTALRFLEVRGGQLGGWRSEEILENAAGDEWLMNLPGLLVRAGLVAEAAAVAERAARADPGNAELYPGDLARELGEAGLAEEAARRAEENLRSFPDESWVLVTSGFAYAPSDPERADALFRRAISVARAGESPSEVEEVYEQYLEFLAGQPSRKADREAVHRDLGRVEAISWMGHGRGWPGAGDWSHHEDREGRTQRTVPMRERSQVQALLRRLTAFSTDDRPLTRDRSRQRRTHRTRDTMPRIHQTVE